MKSRKNGEETGAVQSNLKSVRRMSPEKRKKWVCGYMSANWQLYILLAVIMAYFIIFKYLPIYGLKMAFMEFNPRQGFQGSPWVGLKQFEKLFGNRQFWPTLRNTLMLSLYSLVAGMPFPLIFALVLNSFHNERFKKVTQTITYAPHFISTVVIVGMLKLFLSPSSGVVNHLIVLLGGEAINFFGSATAFPHMFVWSDIWQNTGWNAVIYIAALSGIDPSLHEAAMVDGAGRLRRIIHIDIPGILPTFTILLIMRLGSIINVGFEKVYLMQTSLNASTSETIATYAYKVGLEKAQYSYSAAVDMFNSCVTFAMLMLVNFCSRKLTETSLW